MSNALNTNVINKKTVLVISGPFFYATFVPFGTFDAFEDLRCCLDNSFLCGLCRKVLCSSTDTASADLFAIQFLEIWLLSTKGFGF